MEDKLKYFMYGLLAGGRPLNRIKEPTEIPIQQLSIGYDNDRMILGERQVLTVSIFPVEASYQEVEWISSDISIISVNKITPTSAEVLANSTGDVYITCRATDGSGVSTSIKLHCIGDEVFSKFSLGGYYGGIGQGHAPDCLVEVNYEPKTMGANKWGIEIRDSLGEELPYSIIDTPFKNIKAIRTLFNTDEYINYFNYINTGVNPTLAFKYDAITKDGSGLRADNNNINTIDLQAIQGKNLGTFYYNTENISEQTIDLKVGYLVSLYDTVSVKQSLYDTDVTLEGEEYISLDSYGMIHGISEGTGKITIKFKNNTTIVLNINVVNTVTKTSRPTVKLFNKQGKEIRWSNDGMLDIGDNTVYLGIAYTSNSSGGIVKIKSLNDYNSAEITSDGGVLIHNSNSITVYYELRYNNGTSEQIYNGNINIRIRSNNISPIGIVSSEYLTDGVVVYVRTGTIFNFNGYLVNKINVVYNSNQLELKQILNCDFNIRNTDTLVFTPSLNSFNGTVSLYHFKKMVDTPVTVEFNIVGDELISNSIII